MNIMDKPITFFVKGIAHHADGERIVVGVPDNRLPLRVGSTFVQKYEIAKEDVHKHPSERQHINIKSIRLTIRQIESYRRVVDELPPGVTGNLVLDGDGISEVVDFCLLTTAAK
jgi:hypothetical protein